MDNDEEQITETAEEAREGVNVPGMVPVLIVSIVVVILVLAAVWLLWQGTDRLGLRRRQRKVSRAAARTDDGRRFPSREGCSSVA